MRLAPLLTVASLVSGVTGVTGCAATDDPVDDAGDDLADDGKGDRGTAPAFYEVDPGHSTLTFRRYITAAINHLAADDSEIARLTAASIRAGRVRIDELSDLTCWDFERIRAELPELELTPADFADLRDRGSPVLAAIVESIDGYMWSDRIYVSRGLPVARLAATLVHEVNHVLNQSEVGYWDDFPTSAFVHEYRSFYAQAMFDPDEYDGVDLVDHVIELYGLDRDAIDPAVLAAPLTPRLLPDAAGWRTRDVASDAPDDESACPGR